MKSLIANAARDFLFPGKHALVEQIRFEYKLASYHKEGLRQIRRRSLSRPSKLNLGCGPYPKDGFLNVDLFPGGDITLDLRRGLPFEPDSCDLIFSEHCFEHFEYPEPISHLFRECLRVLKPGGFLKFTVPDTEWPLNQYREGPEAPYFKACEEHAWHPKECTTRLEHINYHFRQGAEHKYAYDLETAQKVLGLAGFVDIHRRGFEPSMDSEHRKLGSLFISARKPA